MGVEGGEVGACGGLARSDYVFPLSSLVLSRLPAPLSHSRTGLPKRGLSPVRRTGKQYKTHGPHMDTGLDDTPPSAAPRGGAGEVVGGLGLYGDSGVGGFNSLQKGQDAFCSVNHRKRRGKSIGHGAKTIQESCCSVCLLLLLFIITVPDSLGVI